MSGFRLSLSLGNRRKLRRPEKHLENVVAWAKSFDGFFPDGDDLSSMQTHWHLPVDERLVDPPVADPAHRRRALQSLLDAAALVRRARPDRLVHQRVYVAVFWPAPSGSEFGVFLDPDYGRDFERRDHPSQTWTPFGAQSRSLVREIGLTIPEGFVETGYQERSEEEDADAADGLFVFEREVWMIREPPLD